MVRVLFFYPLLIDFAICHYLYLRKKKIMNYLLMTIGQILEALSFFASLPSVVLSSLARAFYFAGSPDNNDIQEDGE